MRKFNQYEVSAMLYVETKSTDPYYNLALEQYLFDTVGQTEELFFLWQNDNTIVVGKHQNTVEEINAEFVREHGIRVVRRLSGGGAVYHDLGNLNFTFIADAGDASTLDLHLFCQPVAKALAELGVEAEVTGRNDITIDGKKFSGNAQYMKRGRVMHHGTIMFDSNLEVVSQALKVSADKIESKGIKSVRSRVTNVRPCLKRDVGLEEFRAVLVRSIFGTDAPRRWAPTAEDEKAIRSLRDSQYATWEWNYGESPRYTARKERRVEGVGKLECYLQVEEGVLEGLEIYGDFFGEGETGEVARALAGCRMEEDALLAAVNKLDIERYFHNLDPAELVRILIS